MNTKVGLIQRLARMSTVSLLCLTFAGCGAEDEGISESEYISRSVENICSLIFTCSCENLDPEYTKAQCVETRTQLREVAATVADIDGLSFDGECAEEEVAEILTQACEPNEIVQGADPVCERPCKLYYGPMKAGESCEFGTSGRDNCKQGSSCVDGLCEDPCDELAPANLGELCYALPCIEGAWCDVSTPYAPVCVPRPGFEQPCADTNPDVDVTNYICADGLYCDEVTDPMNPTCLAFPNVGEECPAGDCVEGAYCDFTLTPELCVDIPGIGESCTFVCEPGSFCDDVCPAGADCDNDPSLLESICVENGAAICATAPVAP